MVSNKMMTEQMNMISDKMNQGIFTNGEITLNPLNLSYKELLKIAFEEPKLTQPIGACGTVCEGTCDTCEEHVKQLSEFFCVKILEEQDEQWEAEQRAQKEHDEYAALDCNCLGCLNYDDYYEDRYDYYYDDWWSEEDEEEDDDEAGLAWNESGYFD
jgi:hypothetical protein